MILPLILTGKDSAEIQGQLLKAIRDLNLKRDNIIALTAYAYHATHGDVHVTILLYDPMPTVKKPVNLEGSDDGAV